MEESGKGKLNLIELIALVVGSIIGGGVFNLMHDMSAGAGAGAIIIGWVITAIGMLMLAKTFQNLTMKRPDLDAGVYSYAEAGFGKYMGFNSAWGYWLSAWLGNVGYATLLMSAVGYFFPVFGDGQNIWSIVAASFILWACHFMILRGVESASFVNTIITVAKLIPIFIFLVTMVIAFRLGVFTHGFWFTPTGTFQFGNVMSQVRNTMLVTVWVFIGIEGAVVFFRPGEESEGRWPGNCFRYYYGYLDLCPDHPVITGGYATGRLSKINAARHGRLAAKRCRQVGRSCC